MDKLADVTAVGGGVVGCFIAYRLALEGGAVTVLEREHVGAGASGALADNVQPGILVHGRQHPFPPMILPEQALQGALAR
jgi:glycine oxidase